MSLGNDTSWRVGRLFRKKSSPARHAASCRKKGTCAFFDNLSVRTGRSARSLFSNAETLEDPVGDVLPHGGAGELPQGGEGLLHVGKQGVRGDAGGQSSLGASSRSSAREAASSWRGVGEQLPIGLLPVCRGSAERMACSSSSRPCPVLALSSTTGGHGVQGQEGGGGGRGGQTCSAPARWGARDMA